jgi:hypothetical protein
MNLRSGPTPSEISPPERLPSPYDGTPKPAAAAARKAFLANPLYRIRPRSGSAL